MTPFGHLAVSVLLVHGRGYAGRGAVLCLFGALLPDLIDKPPYFAGLTVVSHTVGHSAVVLALATAVLLAVPRLRTWLPLAVGAAGHVAGDVLVAYPGYVVNYAWPVLGPRRPPQDGLVTYWIDYALGPFGALEATLILAALLLTRARGLDLGRRSILD